MSKSSTGDVKDLLQGARDEGLLSDCSMMVIDNIDLGAQVQAAMGIPAMEAQSSEVIILNILVDDSGSIAGYGNEDSVRKGCNMVLDSLMATKQKGSIFVHIRYINGKVLCPYVSLANAPRLDSSNYQANGGTPLYDEIAALLATAIAKTQEYSEQGIPARSISVIITDGNDQYSRVHSSKDVASLVKDMLAMESHLIVAMGISDGNTDFNSVFAGMGFDLKWILTPANTGHDIREAFRTVSQSAVRASQTATFTDLGGFGNP